MGWRGEQGRLKVEMRGAGSDESDKLDLQDVSENVKCPMSNVEVKRGNRIIRGNDRNLECPISNVQCRS